jgi:hypothetical protein
MLPSTCKEDSPTISNSQLEKTTTRSRRRTINGHQLITITIGMTKMKLHRYSNSFRLSTLTSRSAATPLRQLVRGTSLVSTDKVIQRFPRAQLLDKASSIRISSSRTSRRKTFSSIKSSSRTTWALQPKKCHKIHLGRNTTITTIKVNKSHRYLIVTQMIQHFQTTRARGISSCNKSGY